jgi:hypothetical protein
MLKRGAAGLILFVVLTVLAGCRVVWVDQSLEEAQTQEKAKGSEVVTLEARIQFDQKRMVIRGQTNLPQGTILLADLKEYPDGAEQKDVLNGEVEPENETALEKEGEINEDGTFTIVLDRPDTEKRYQAAVRFAPEIQPGEIQQIYGETGEMIGDGEGSYEYETDGTLITGIARFAPVFSLADGGWYRGKFEMSPKIGEARPSH